MIVVTSNWALGDGTLVPAVAPWHATLTTAIHRAVLRAGVRGDGSYRPLEGLDLVLAGDTFDWLLSAEWLGGPKPWQGTLAAREAATRVARRSFRAARRVLGPVIHWARHGLAVPAAARGRPGRTAVSIPVRVTLLAGDRDAALEHHVGRRDARQPVTTGSRWDDGRVSIRHGHELDPACRTTGGQPAPRDRQPTLAESVAVDLVGRFAAAVRPLAPAGKRLVSRLAAAAAPGVVFGHLPAVEDAAAACLGPVPGAVDGAVPRLIACVETEGWPRWQSVLPVEDRAAVVAIRAPERAAADGGRIVDAA